MCMGMVFKKNIIGWRFVIFVKKEACQQVCLHITRCIYYFLFWGFFCVLFCFVFFNGQTFTWTIILDPTTELKDHRVVINTNITKLSQITLRWWSRIIYAYNILTRWAFTWNTTLGPIHQYISQIKKNQYNYFYT